MKNIAVFNNSIGVVGVLESLFIGFMFGRPYY